MQNSNFHLLQKGDETCIQIVSEFFILLSCAINFNQKSIFLILTTKFINIQSKEAVHLVRRNNAHMIGEIYLQKKTGKQYFMFSNCQLGHLIQIIVFSSFSFLPPPQKMDNLFLVMTDIQCQRPSQKSFKIYN